MTQSDKLVYETVEFLVKIFTVESTVNLQSVVFSKESEDMFTFLEEINLHVT